MKRRTRILAWSAAAAAAFAVALTGCGPSATVAQAPSQAPSFSGGGSPAKQPVVTETPKAKPSAQPVGTLFTVSGDGEPAYQIKLDQVKYNVKPGEFDTVKAGHQLVGLHFWAKAGAANANPDPYAWVTALGTDHVGYHPEVMMSDGQFDSSPMAFAGQHTSGWVDLEVPSGVKITVVSYDATFGTGTPAQWQVG